jgi:hypothetical protein
MVIAFELGFGAGLDAGATLISSGLESPELVVLDAACSGASIAPSGFDDASAALEEVS